MNPAHEKAAKLAITGMLSVAAVANPAFAGEQEDRLEELMKAWNEEYGAEFGQWDMSGYRSAIKATEKPKEVPAAAPDVKITRKTPEVVDPIEQVMAEWNKEYGDQYGTWDMSGYRPAKKAAAAPQPAPEPVRQAPAIVPRKVEEPPKPAEPEKKVEAPVAKVEAPPAKVEEAAPAKVEEAAPAKVEAPPAKVEAPAPVVKAPEPEKQAEAPVPVKAPEVPASVEEEAEPSEGSTLGVLVGGLVLVGAGALALMAPTGSEEQKPPSQAPTAPPAEGTPAPPPSADAPADKTEGPK